MYEIQISLCITRDEESRCNVVSVLQLAIAEMEPLTALLMELLPEEIVCIALMAAAALVLKDRFSTIVLGT